MIKVIITSYCIFVLLHFRLSITGTNLQSRKISTESLTKVTVTKSVTNDAPKSPTITEETNTEHPTPKAITDVLSQETSDIQEGRNEPSLDEILNKSATAELHECNNSDEHIGEISKPHQTSTVTVQTSVGYTTLSVNGSQEPNGDSRRKSTTSAKSDVSDSKASSSAVHVSVLDNPGSSGIATKCGSARHGALDDTTTLFESKTLENHAANHIRHSKGQNDKNDKNNDAYFHEIESYFRDENEIPFRSNTPKSHKTKDSLKIKRSHNIQGGCTANSYHREKYVDSKRSTSLHSDSTTNLTSVDVTGKILNEDNIPKRQNLSKKGSRHKVYDRPVQVAEYKSVGNFVMHPKPKLKDRVLSDIPSSRTCTPEQDNELSESGTNNGQQDTDCIDLKLPQTESLL